MATRKKSAAKTRSSRSKGTARKRSAPKALKKKVKKSASASPGKKTARKGSKKALPKRKVSKQKVSRKKKTSKKPVAKKVGRKAATKKPATKKARSQAAKKPATKKAARKPSGRKAPGRKAVERKTPPPPPRRRLSTFADAVKVYEAAVRLMHAEKFEQARSRFDDLISGFPAETELLDRANVLIQACDNRIREAKAGPRLKGANEFYEVGVAELNSGALDEALEHLEHALKLLPKADHILYALGALSALRGERDKALDYLSRSISQREENRYLAVNDVDFESLAEDPVFLELTSSESA